MVGGGVVLKKEDEKDEEEDGKEKIRAGSTTRKTLGEMKTDNRK